MERNRRGGGASASGIFLAPRIQRGRNSSGLSGPLTDEERKTDDMSDLSCRKRPKEDMYGLGASANLLNKRKRWGMAQGSQPFGFLEEMKAEHDDEPSAPPQLQKYVKSRVRSKDNKFFIDFSAVPRKQRSSITLSSRLTSTAKDQQDKCSTQQQSPETMINKGLSNKKKRLKHFGTEHNTIKVPQVSDFSALSDQEAEVAEALFVLASSTPSHTGIMHSKLDTKLDTEATISATLQHLVVVPDFASAGSKGKQLQNNTKKEEEKSPTNGVVYSASSPSELVHSSVGDTELDLALPPRRLSLAEEATSFGSDALNSKIPAGSPHCVPRWSHKSKETTPIALEEQCKDSNGGEEVRQEIQINAVIEEVQHREVNKMSTAVRRNDLDSSKNCDESIRSDGVYHNSQSKRGIMAMEDENKREKSSSVLVKESSWKGLNAGSGYLKLKGRADGETQGLNQEAKDQKGKPTSQTARRTRDRDGKQDHSAKLSPNRKVKDAGNSSVSSCFSSLSSTAVSRHAPMVSTGWMNGVPHWGCYDGSATTSCAGSSNLSMDMKGAQPAVQLPYAATFLPVPKMKSCATHVYVAHYIHHAQQATRRSLWSAAFCGATAYNFNPSSKEAFCGPTHKAQTHQSSMCKMASNGSVHSSSVAGSISVLNLSTISRALSETSTVTASGHAMPDHAQYLQPLMHPSCATSFPNVVNEQCGQAAQFYSGPFFQPHLTSHLQPLTQQAAMVPPVQKQQPAKGASSSAVEKQKKSSSPLQKLPQNLEKPLSAHLETKCKDLSLMAPSGGVHVGRSQEGSASLSSGQCQYLTSQDTFPSTGHKVKRLDESFSSKRTMIVGASTLGPISAASMVTIEDPVQGSHKRDQKQRTSIHEAMSAYENAFIMKKQGNNEGRRVTRKEGGPPFDLSKATVEHSSGPLCGYSDNSYYTSVNDGPIISSMSISGTQSCESASTLLGDQLPCFLVSQQMSLEEAKVQSSCLSRTPSTLSRVHSLASAASHNALEAVTVWSSPPSISKGVLSPALESLSDGALPSHPSRDDAQHEQQAGPALQCLDSDAQTLHTQQEQNEGVFAPSLTANGGFHSNSLESTSTAFMSETTPKLEYIKPLPGGGISTSSPISETTVVSI